MKWFRLRDKTHLPASERALEDAKANLAEIESRDEEVKRVAKEVTLLREENHFTEKLHAIMSRG